MTIKHRFTNLDASPMTLVSPKWQTELITRISEEYNEEAVKVNEEFRQRAAEIVDNPKAIYSGPAILRLVREIPKITYIKAYDAPDGHTYDVQIDLLAMTVSFIEIDKKED